MLTHRTEKKGGGVSFLGRCDSYGVIVWPTSERSHIPKKRPPTDKVYGCDRVSDQATGLRCRVDHRISDKPVIFYTSHFGAIKKGSRPESRSFLKPLTRLLRVNFPNRLS